MTPSQLIAWRTQNRLTQARLAAMLKVDPRTVRRWEAGKSAIPTSLQGTIATFREGVSGKVEEDPLITFNTHPHLYEPWNAKTKAVRLPAHPDYDKPKGLGDKGARVSALAMYVAPTPEEIAAKKAARGFSLGNFIQSVVDEGDE